VCFSDVAIPLVVLTRDVQYTFDKLVILTSDVQAICCFDERHLSFDE
jgi:hypothetical protein